MAPVLAIAHSASTEPMEREMPMATMSPGPIPRPISSRATREEASSSSR
ncbi:Uncharacterised protein [Mycobacteroides abscessus subsp. abscessus]|nr:Uncharacterised protein [Mycobacteroides abscessus subsp. abscessus]